MPTPNSFKQIAIKWKPYKWHYLGATAFGFATIIISLMVTVKLDMNFFPVVGIGMFVSIWAWGAFLIVNWYSKEPNPNMKLPKPIKAMFTWYAAIFLDAWFLVGGLGCLMFIWNSIQN